MPSSVGVVDHEEYRTPARISALIAGGRAHEVLRNLLLDLDAAGRLQDVAGVLSRYFEGSIDRVSFDRVTVLKGLGAHENAISVLESLGSVDSIDAYQVIAHRKVLLVEGSGDTRFLRALAAKRESHVFEGSDRLVVIETGGESTATARSDLAILEKIMGDDVRSLQLLDRDARMDAFADAAEAAQARPVHVWRRDAMESYLVLPQVIARLVVQRRDDLDADGVEARVTAMRDEAVASLKDETFDRVATRYRHDMIARDSRNVEPAEANQAAREALADPELLVRLTHGKHLLAAIRQAVQDEYKVSFGNQALIAEATADEFDPELWTVLDEIEALAAG